MPLPFTKCEGSETMWKRADTNYSGWMYMVLLTATHPGFVALCLSHHLALVWQDKKTPLRSVFLSIFIQFFA